MRLIYCKRGNDEAALLMSSAGLHTEKGGWNDHIDFPISGSKRQARVKNAELEHI